MELDNIALMQLVEHFLSFTGLVAILFFTAMWIKKVMTHTKDMDQLDKVVRDTMREALDGVKEVRKIDKEIFENKINEVNVKFEKISKDKVYQDKEITLYKNLVGLVGNCCDFTTYIAENDFVDALEAAMTGIESEMQKLVDSSALNPEEFATLLQKAERSGDTPKERDVRTFLFLKYLSHVLGKLHGLADSCLYAMPIILDEFIKNPNRDPKDIWASLPERLLLNDLPRKLSKKSIQATVPGAR